MKFYRAAAVLMVSYAAISLAAQEVETPDTIKVVEDVEKVVVTRSGNTTRIDALTHGKSEMEKFSYNVNVSESSSDDLVDDITGIDLSFLSLGSTKNRKSIYKGFSGRLKRNIIFMGNIYIGQRFNYFDKGNVKNSIEFGVRDIVGLKWSHGRCTPAFSIGIGMSGQRYTASDGFCYSLDNYKLSVTPVPDGVRPKSTHLYVFTVQVPMIYTQPIGNSLKFMLGGIACFNCSAWSTTSYVANNVTYKEIYKGLQQRLFTAEALCSLGICNTIGVYASWSPMTLFEKEFGPQLKSWSIGATIGF